MRSPELVCFVCHGKAYVFDNIYLTLKPSPCNHDNSANAWLEQMPLSANC